MTPAVRLLDRCQALGVKLHVAPDGGALTWEADTDPPADLLADLAANKDAVLALIDPGPASDAAIDALISADDYVGFWRWLREWNESVAGRRPSKPEADHGADRPADPCRARWPD
jgi:hypothetical protein